MDIPGLNPLPPSDGATTSSTSRTFDRASPKTALAGFPTLEAAHQPNRGMAPTLSALSVDFTTPTKAGASPKSKSTTKKQPAKLASLSLASPSKKYSTAETPRSKKGISNGLSIISLGPSSTRTPSPKKVSFADESFTSLSASTPKHFSGFTPKLARSLSPKSSPSKPAISDFSVMSITSPTTPQLFHDKSDTNKEQFETHGLEQSPSKSAGNKEFSNWSSLFDPSPSKIEEQDPETNAGLESPSRADTTMHDVTMMSDFASPRKFQACTFATVEPSDAAKRLCAPFDPKSYEDVDFTSILSPIPGFTRRPARVPRMKQRRKARGIILEKAIAKQVSESLAVEELEAAVQFRHIAVKGELAYALCPRKRQRVAEASDDDYSQPYWLDEEVEERPIINMIEARRVLRNDLFALPAGPTVNEQRRQYLAEMEKYGEPMASTRGKRNYDGEAKRAYNNGLLTHAIMKPLLAFPMPDLSFEWVLETAIRDSNRAQGREQHKHRNVRQPIAVFGESDFSVIEEEEEPQSPTAKLPHFPSTATHHSGASRKNRLDQGLVSLRTKLAAFATQELEPVPPSPLSSPIGPGFTFEVPSFISSPSVSHMNQGDEVEGTPEETVETSASPIVYFKDRSQTSPFKKRKSLPATRRPSLTSLLRRVSLPLTLPAADSGQPPVVQDLREPASGSLVGAPDSSVELPALQNPPVADSASVAVVQVSPVPVGGASPSALALASPVGSPSPSPVVVDVRENPDIFGSFLERPDSPVQAVASLAHVFEEAKDERDAKVVVHKEGDRLIVRFRVSDEHAALFAAEEAPAAPMSPVVAAAHSEEGGEDEEKEEEEKKDEVSQVPDQAPVPALDDEDSDLVMLREFMNRHAARKAAKASEPIEPAADLVLSPTPTPAAALSPIPLPSAPIFPAIAPTPERAQSIWADTPAFSVTSSAERPRSAQRASRAGSVARRPLGALDVNSPSPRKAKRKSDGFEEREASPEKPPQPPKRQRRERVEKPNKDENEKPEEDAAPVPGVRTRAQRAAERGEAPLVTKIPVRHQGYAKVRSGEKDLAALTRQNTRTNKGSAVPAEQVLESLKNAPPTVETRAAAAARKEGKSVQWAEQLSRSQSEDPSSAPLSPIEEKEVGKTRGRPKGSTNKTAPTKASAATKTSTAAKVTKARQPAIPSPKTDSAKVTKPKKVTAAAKKELGLSANGTPAKRSARIAKK